MQTERAELYFRQGSSDKVYHLQLEKENDQWSVHAHDFGRFPQMFSNCSASELGSVDILGTVFVAKGRQGEAYGVF